MSGFALLPALSMLASLVLLPLISRKFGSSGWIALGLGQSIGAVVSVVVGMAWPVIGGNAIARAADPEERRAIFQASAYSRIVVLVVLLLVAVPLTLVLSTHYPWATTFFMLGVALNGLTAAWFYAGIGAPRHLILNEGLVRLGGYAVALVGLMAGAGLIWYAIATTLAGLVMFTLNWLTIMGRRRLWTGGALRIATGAIREQLAGTVSRVLQAAFTFGGNTIFAIVNPAALPLYTAMDQVQKAGNNTLGFLPNSFVHWVGSAPVEDRRRRMLRSVYLLGAVALLTIPGWLLLGPTVLKLLYANQLQLSWPGHLLLVATISSVLFCSSFELLVLIPLGHAGAVYRGNSVASLLGLAGVALGAYRYGALGGVGAWVLLHSLLMLYYLIVLLRRRRAALD